MKKILAVILAVMMCFSATTYVLADDGSGKKDVGEHEHELMDMANAACHYSECTICFELFNVGDHTFVDGKCSVCGHYAYGNPADEDIKGEGAHEHIFMKSADDETHFEECLVCHERFGVGKHEFENGKCYVCGHPLLVNPFVDVKDTAWYRNDIVAAVKLGIINGKSETIFAPDDYLTYAEAVKLAACMNQRSVEGKVTLTNGTPWYQTYVDYCKENGIISKDYEYSKFATRAGYMEIFANALTDEALKEINDIADGAIPDVQMTDSFAGAVYKLYRAGILQGVDAKFNCNPRANIKRGEVAVILLRMMDEDKRVQFEIPGYTTDKEEVKTKYETIEEDEDEEKNVPEIDYTKADTVTDAEVKVETKDTVYVEVLPSVDYEIEIAKPTISELQIYKQPEGYEAEEYGGKYELEVVVFGGKAPYKYTWYYKGYRGKKTLIENGDYVKDATTEAPILSIEKENTLLGAGIFCEITDSLGDKVTTDTVKVYGPFSMPVEQSLNQNGENVLTGRVADGIIKKGDKVSVIRNGKVVAIGYANDIQMFEKSMDEAVKGDNVGIVFSKEDGVRPSNGDTVVKYQPYHKLDTSDVIN